MIPVNPKSVQHGSRSRTNPRTGKPLYFSDPEKVKYQNLIKQEVEFLVKDGPLDGPLSVGWKFYFERPKKLLGACPDQAIPMWGFRGNDLTNITKGIEDALTRAGLWIDDAQIQRYDFAEKWYSEESLFPRIELTVCQYKMVIT